MVHQDAVLRQLGGQRPGQAQGAHLGGADVGPAGPALEGVEPRDVHDTAPAVLDHRRHHRLTAEVGTVEIDRRDRPPLLQANLGEGAGLSESGVVDQYVDASEGLHRPVDHGVDLLLHANVRQGGDGPDAQVGGLLCDRLRLLCVAPGVDHHVGAAPRQLQYGRPAYVPARAGDQGNPILEALQLAPSHRLRSAPVLPCPTTWWMGVTLPPTAPRAGPRRSPPGPESALQSSPRRRGGPPRYALPPWAWSPPPSACG